MPRKLTSAVRVTTILITVAVFFWSTLIAAPEWLTRWRLSQLLADYHAIHPTQSTWWDAQRLMARWGQWGHHEGACTSTECDYSIKVDDAYTGWIEKLSEANQNRIYSGPVLAWVAHRVRYRAGGLTVRFQVRSGTIVWTYSAMTIDVEDAGSPDHFQYPLIITARTRSNLSRYPRPPDKSGLYVLGAQLDLHPDYVVSRPDGCEICVMDKIAYTPALPHEVMVQLTGYNLACFTQWHPCTSIGDLLPFGSGWRLWEDGRSSLYPTSSKGSLPCRVEPRALARDAATVLEVQAISALPNLKAYGEDLPRELSRVRVLHAWKNSPPAAGSIIQVSPFQGQLAYEQDKSSAAYAGEHLLPGHRALLFAPESTPIDFGGGKAQSVVAYSLDRCGVIDDTPANLAAIQVGIVQDVPYPQTLRQDGSW